MPKHPIRWLCPNIQWGQHEIIQWSPYHSSNAPTSRINLISLQKMDIPQCKGSNSATMLQWKYSPSWLCLNISELTTIEGSCLVYVNKSINLNSHCQKRKYLNIIHMNQKPCATWMWMKWLCPSINHLKWLCSNENTLHLGYASIYPSQQLLRDHA